MRPAWGVALLFALPSLALALLIQYAFTLDPRGGPFLAAGVVVLPWIAGASRARAAFARGLLMLAMLALFLALIVHLRLWTRAGGPVLARDGVLGVSRWLALWAIAAVGLGWWLSRPRRLRDTELSGPIE